MELRKSRKPNNYICWYLTIVLFLFLILTARTKSGDTLDYKMPQPYNPAPNSWNVVWEQTPNNLLFSFVFGLFAFAATKYFIKDN